MPLLAERVKDLDPAPPAQTAAERRKAYRETLAHAYRAERSKRAGEEISLPTAIERIKKAQNHGFLPLEPEPCQQ